MSGNVDEKWLVYRDCFLALTACIRQIPPEYKASHDLHFLSCQIW